MKVVWTALVLAIMVASCERKEESVDVDSSPDREEVPVPTPDPEDENPAGGDDEEEEPDEDTGPPVLIEKKPPVAEPVPGQPGYVKSPYNDKIIDVTGIPPGTLVADPTYPAEEKKHFRVPEMPEQPVEPIEPPRILDPSILINPGGSKDRPKPPPEESEETGEPKEAE